MPLISAKRLCQSDLDVLFTSKHIFVTNSQGTTVLAGTLNPATELYMVSLHDAPESDALLGETLQQHTEQQVHTPSRLY